MSDPNDYEPSSSEEDKPGFWESLFSSPSSAGNGQTSDGSDW